MATVILLRHAKSTANGSGVLAGRSAGVGLDDTGRDQAARLLDRIGELPLAAVVTSPMQRCQETVAGLVAHRGLEPADEPRLAEVDYGDWTGSKLADLTKEKLWQVVQQHPSAAVFPNGEGLADVQARAVAAIRQHDAAVTAEHGPNALWLACSHGDVIKAVLADALGMHLDGFQRIMVDPCSVSVIRYTELRPFVARVNDTGGDVSNLIPPPEPEGAESNSSNSSDAVVGGSTGA